LDQTKIVKTNQIRLKLLDQSGQAKIIRPIRSD